MFLIVLSILAWTLFALLILASFKGLTYVATELAVRQEQTTS